MLVQVLGAGTSAVSWLRDADGVSAAWLMALVCWLRTTGAPWWLAPVL